MEGKGNGKVRRAPRLATLFLGGLLLIVLGLAVWEMGVLYVKLVARSTPVSAQTRSEAGILSLPEISFWTCQTGVFQQEENARRQVQALTRQGWKAEVVSANPWSVGIGFSLKPEELQSLRRELSRLGTETVMKQVMVPERSFRISGKGAQETAVVLTGVNALLRSGYAQGSWENNIKAIEQGIFGNTIKEFQTLQQAILEAQASTQLELLPVFVQYENLLNNMSERRK